MPNSEPGGEAGRVRCLYCGANNFPASAACWQCSRPLKTTPSGMAAPGQTEVTSGPSLMSSPLMASAPAMRAPAIELSLAPKAAAALGLMFPYVGLPVGIIFLMLDDPRKTQLGWLLIGWSVLGSVLNGIGLLVTLVPLWSFLKGAHPGGAAPNGIPGVPNLGGDGEGLLLFGRFMAEFQPFHV